jgi:hypothetical protein
VRKVPGVVASWGGSREVTFLAYEAQYPTPLPLSAYLPPPLLVRRCPAHAFALCLFVHQPTLCQTHVDASPVLPALASDTGDSQRFHCCYCRCCAALRAVCAACAACCRRSHCRLA